MNIQESLNNPDWLVRSDAIEEVGDKGLTEYLPNLIDCLLHDINPTVRASAAEVIGELGNESHMDILKEVLLNKAEDEVVRAYAVYSLGLLGNSLYLPKLHSLKSIFKPNVRIYMDLLGALYCLGSKESLIELVELLDEVSEDLYIPILNILSNIKERVDKEEWKKDIEDCIYPLTILCLRYPLTDSQVDELLA